MLVPASNLVSDHEYLSCGSAQPHHVNHSFRGSRLDIICFDLQLRGSDSYVLTCLSCISVDNITSKPLEVRTLYQLLGDAPSENGFKYTLCAAPAPGILELHILARIVLVVVALHKSSPPPSPQWQGSCDGEDFTDIIELCGIDVSIQRKVYIRGSEECTFCSLSGGSRPAAHETRDDNGAFVEKLLSECFGHWIPVERVSDSYDGKACQIRTHCIAADCARYYVVTNMA